MRRLLAFLVKATVSALLLYLSLRRVDLDSVGQRLGGLDRRWIAFILFMLCVAMLLVALRWREIVAICGAKLPLAMALRYSFIGQFFSQVLPSTVGGDAVRIWLLARGARRGRPSGKRRFDRFNSVWRRESGGRRHRRHCLGRQRLPMAFGQDHRGRHARARPLGLIGRFVSNS